MNTKTKIYVAAAAFIATAFLFSAIFSRLEISRLENNVTAAKEKAAAIEKAAEESETKAAQYKEKIDYLDKQLSEIGSIAKQQDDELQKITADTTHTRGRVLDARSVRTISISAGELCEKLRKLGHPCE